VRRHRLTHNPARHVNLPRPPRTERVCWSPEQAVTFLRHRARVDHPLTELYEVILSTGMRKGEALALHWAEVHLESRLLFVRYTWPTSPTPRRCSAPPRPEAAGPGSGCPSG
jgi:integrase